jgi:hypothetical protein
MAWPVPSRVSLILYIYLPFAGLYLNEKILYFLSRRWLGGNVGGHADHPKPTPIALIGFVGYIGHKQTTPLLVKIGELFRI